MLAKIEGPPIDARAWIRARNRQIQTRVHVPRRIALRGLPVVIMNDVFREPVVSRNGLKRGQPLVTVEVLEARVTNSAAIRQRRPRSIGVAEPTRRRLANDPNVMIPVQGISEQLHGHTQ